MIELLGQLNTREIAVLVWSGVLLAGVLTIPGVRQSVGGIFQSLIDRKIVTLLLFVAACFVALIAVLRWIGYWRSDLVKDTIVWFFLAGLALVFYAVTSNHLEPLLRRVLRDSLGLLVLFEFVSSAYTFSLPWELVLIPAVSLVTIFDAVAETDVKYASVKRLTGWALAAFAFFMLGSVIWHLVNDFSRIDNPGAVRAMLLPVVLSVGFLPAASLLGAYSTYEQVFLRMSFGPDKERDILRYARWRLIGRFRFDLGRAHRFLGRNALDLMHLQSRRDVQNLLLKESVQHAADRRAHVGTWTGAEELEE